MAHRRFYLFHAITALAFLACSALAAFDPPLASAPFTLFQFHAPEPLPSDARAYFAALVILALLGFSRFAILRALNVVYSVLLSAYRSLTRDAGTYVRDSALGAHRTPAALAA